MILVSMSINTATKFIPTALMVVGLMLQPNLASAQLVPCSGSECGTCQVVQLVEGIVDFIILLSVAIATIIIMWAGYLMLSAGGNSGQIKRGRDVLTNAIIGLIIVLACWLIVDIMLRSLLPGGTVAGLPWNQVQCSSQNAVSDNPNPYSPGGSGWTGVPATGGSAAAAPFNVSYQTTNPSSCVGYYNASTNECNTTSDNLPTGGAPVNVTYQTTNPTSCIGYYDSSSGTCHTTSDNLPTTNGGNSSTGGTGSTGGINGGSSPLQISIGAGGAQRNLTIDTSQTYTINDPPEKYLIITTGDNHGDQINLTGNIQSGMLEYSNQVTGSMGYVGCALVQPPIPGCQ